MPFLTYTPAPFSASLSQTLRDRWHRPPRPVCWCGQESVKVCHVFLESCAIWTPHWALFLPWRVTPPALTHIHTHSYGLICCLSRILLSLHHAFIWLYVADKPACPVLCQISIPWPFAYHTYCPFVSASPTNFVPFHVHAAMRTHKGAHTHVHSHTQTFSLSRRGIGVRQYITTVQ